MTRLIALFRLPAAREPASTMEQRVARAERRLAYAEELIDELCHRQNEIEAALERAPVPA